MTTTAPRSRKAPPRPQPPDFEALVEAAGDLIYTLDLDGRFTYVNRAFERVLGFAQAELLGQPFTVVLTPASGPVATRHFRQGVEGADITPFFEVEGRHRDGGVVHLEVRANSLVRDGVLVGRQGVARDINELKALQSLVAQKSQRMTLLEERTRTAMAIYARIAELITDDAGPETAGEGALREVQAALARASAEKHGLAAADLKTLRLLAQGLSNDEIARAIHRSPHTVKDQVQRIMRRLGAKRRAEAVATAHRLGLLGEA